MKNVVVVGSGFGGISAAAYLARSGFRVTVLEKNSWVGGRARLLEKDGFRFDMGPSWYWMPGEHDRWFSDFGVDRAQYFTAERVDPSYRVYFGDIVPGETETVVDMPTELEAAKAVFERYERGAGKELEKYLNDCKRKYDFAMESFIYENYDRFLTSVAARAMGKLPLLNLLQSYGGRVERRFRHPYLRRMLEFPVVFLGSDARSTPAVYTLMNHIDFTLGTWYPAGGFAAIVRAMQQVAEGIGVRFLFEREVTRIEVENGTARTVIARTADGDERYEADVVVANADYPHVERDLIDPQWRGIPEKRWERAKLAPAVFNYYLGFDRKLDEFAHHTFFFDADWDAHFRAVYAEPEWIEEPLFYLHVPSKTDPSSAPTGHEAVFLLVPVAPGMEDTPERRAYYLDHALERMERRTGKELRRHLVFQETMALNDFVRDYNAYKGNAFGLGQTLMQTAWFRPPNRSKKVKNLYFSGQYTIPGTGTTMSMISGKVVTERIRLSHL